MIRIKIILAATLLTTSVLATANEGLVVGEADAVERYQWREIDTTMSETQYRSAYRANRHQLRDFVEDYSESTLVSMGIPRKGIHLMGAMAGAAVTQEATVYLNSGKSFAIDIRDAAEDDRAVYIGVKFDW